MSPQIPTIQTQILPRVASDGGALGPTNQVSSTAPIATLGTAADGVHAAEHHHHEVELWKKITGVRRPPATPSAPAAPAAAPPAPPPRPLLLPVLTCAVRAQVGSVFVAAVFLNWMASEHHHMHTPPPYGYLRVRTKPFPWGDKDLLDVRDTYVDDDDHH